MTGGFSLNTQTTQKISPNLPGRACTSSCCCHQQLRRCPYALFRDRNFRYFQCSLRFFLRLSEDKPWNMDLHISGTSGTGADDPAEKIRSPVSIQLRSRIRFGELLDVHELWINVLPTAIGWRISIYCKLHLICIGIAIPTAAKCLLSLLTFPKGAVPDHFCGISKNQDQLRCNLPDCHCCPHRIRSRTYQRTWNWYRCSRLYHGKRRRNRRELVG